MKTMVTWENYEEYLMLYVDGELGRDEQKALLDFANQHPEVQDELKLYQSTVLIPDMTQVFAGKEQLARKEPAKVIVLGQWVRYGVAAGIILLLGLGITKWLNRGGSDQLSTSDIVKQGTKVTQPKQEEALPEQKIQQLPTEAVKTPAIRQRESNSIAGNSVHSSPKNLVKENTFPKMEIAPVAPIIRELSAENTIEQPLLLAVAEVTSFVAEEEEAEKRRLPGWLPVNEEKREGLQSLKENLDSRLAKAKSLKDNLKDTELALRFGNKELFVINF